MKRPTAGEVRKAKKAELVAWSKELGLGTDGTVPELRTRILNYLEESPEEAGEPVVAKTDEGARPRRKPTEKSTSEGTEGEEPEPPASAEAAEEPTVKEEVAPEAVVEEAPAEEEGVEEEERAVHTPKGRPKLEEAIKEALKLRREIASRRPAFRHQEWFRYKRLGEKWRNPKGMHSKVHRHFGYRPNVVSIGYRGPKAARGLHPSGFKEVLVHNTRELDRIDPKVEAARIARTVGMRKRLAIQAAADEKGVRVLNRREEE